MRRKDRERDRSFAWEVLKKAPYATLSLTDSQGRPYAVPVNQAVDDALVARIAADIQARVAFAIEL